MSSERSQPSSEDTLSAASSSGLGRPVETPSAGVRSVSASPDSAAATPSPEDRVIGSDAAVAVGRFAPDGVEGYRARSGGPLRPTRAEAEADEQRRLDQRWRVVVNGQPTMLPIEAETRFDRIVRPALERTGNTRYPEDAWEIRDRRGRLLYNGDRLSFDTVGELQERGEIVDETLFINLKPGVGA